MLLVIFIAFLFFNRRIRKKNHTILINVLEKNNEALVSRVAEEVNKIQHSSQPNSVAKTKQTASRKIPDKIVNQIKKCLQKFEKKKEFLNPDLKLTKLAEQFETNTKYLAKVIFEETGKPYKNYIKGLKVEVAKSRIDAEYKFRRYKMDVIAKESGFKTAESFSKCFLQTYGVYPSKYIKKVETEFLKLRDRAY